MVELVASIIGALAAGALAKAGGVGGRLVTDAYGALRALIVRKLGKEKEGAVLSVEKDPRSETAQSALAEALIGAGGLSADTELARHADALCAALARAEGTFGAGIEVGDITGKVNVLVSNLVASGRIKLGDVRAETGDATLTNLTAGAGAPKKT
jgi:hypothetical protein